MLFSIIDGKRTPCSISVSYTHLVFASALEHGETEQQVIERLGTPKEFAENTAEQLGIDLSLIHI